MTALSEVDALIAEREAELESLKAVRALLLEDEPQPSPDKAARRQLIADRVEARKKPGKHSESYKRRLVREIAAGGRGMLAQIARREGLGKSTLYYWQKRFADTSAPDLPEEERGGPTNAPGSDGNA